MPNNLTEKEINTATKLIDLGLSKAGSALQSILRSPISITAIDFSIISTKNFPEFYSKKGENGYLLKTILVGDLKGICHLIFSEEEVSKVYTACLPESIISNPSAQNDMMKREFLTEIDNIVAAAAITQFANFLNLNVYGGVPSLHVMNTNVINDYIHEESGSLTSIIKFKAHFSAPEMDIYPDFIWLLDDIFINEIKKLTDSDKVNELLNQ